MSVSSSSSHPLRIVIACGGTGGHLFPGIAVAENLRAQGHETLVLISEKNIDSLAASGHPELKFVKVPAVPLPRPWSPKMFTFIRSNLRAWSLCKKLFREFKADVVLGMGGFTCTVPLMVGRGLKCKTFIHESNAFPGKANRLNARYCDLVLLGFADCAVHFPKRKTQWVGTPLRPALTKTIDRASARRHFGLDPELPTLLIMGGSQGARGVNRNIAASLPFLKQSGMPLQILHITGPSDYDETSAAYANYGISHHVAAFCHEMENAYAAADLIVARSGASSLSEIAWFGLPSILIPYPTAADDHQTKNAEIFFRVNAARLVTEKDLTGETLAKIVLEMMNSPELLRQMSTQAAKLAVRDSVQQITKLVTA